jgi:site-specific recombinase XerD
MATITEIKRKTRGVGYQISFMHPVTKKQVRKIVWCSKKDAIKIQKQIDLDIAFGIFNMESENQVVKGYTWSDLESKYKRFSKANKSPKTVKRESWVFIAFEEFLGTDFKIVDITNQTIELFRDHRLSLGKKPASVALEMRHLKVIFNMGIKWDYCNINPVIGVKMPKVDIIKVRFLLLDEINDLLEVIEKDGNLRFKNLVMAYLNTGARRTELLPPLFTWEDVNFKGKKILLQGKRDKKRYIPINDTLYQVLKENKSNGQEHPFEFKPSYVSHKIQKYYKLANIKGANLHSLRKTFGSLMIQKGNVELFTVSKLLGHSSISTTEKYYVDLLDENYCESVDTLVDIM